MIAVSGMMLVEVALDDAQVAGVGLEEIIGDGADPRDQAEQEVGADIAAHPRHLPLRHAEVARFPHHVAAERRAGDAADPGDEVEQHVEPDLLVGAGDGEGAFEHMLERLDPLRAPRAGRGRAARCRDRCGARTGSKSSRGAPHEIGERVAGEAIVLIARGAVADQRPAHRRGKRDEQARLVDQQRGLAEQGAALGGVGRGARRIEQGVGLLDADRGPLAAELAQEPGGRGRGRDRVDPLEVGDCPGRGALDARSRARASRRPGARTTGRRPGLRAARRVSRGRSASPNRRCASCCERGAALGQRLGEPRRLDRGGERPRAPPGARSRAAGARGRRARRSSASRSIASLSRRRTSGSASGPSRRARDQPEQAARGIEPQRAARQLGARGASGRSSSVPPSTRSSSPARKAAIAGRRGDRPAA